MTEQKQQAMEAIHDKLHDARRLLSESIEQLEYCNFYGIASDVKKAYEQAVSADNWLVQEISESA